MTGAGTGAAIIKISHFHFDVNSYLSHSFACHFLSHVIRHFVVKLFTLFHISPLLHYNAARSEYCSSFQPTNLIWLILKIFPK